MAESSDFNTWLCGLLDKLGLDGDVYGEYIAGTLRDMADATSEEKMESLQEFLAGAIVSTHDYYYYYENIIYYFILFTI